MISLNWIDSMEKISGIFFAIEESVFTLVRARKE